MITGNNMSFAVHAKKREERMWYLNAICGLIWRSNGTSSSKYDKLVFSQHHILYHILRVDSYAHLSARSPLLPFVYKMYETVFKLYVKLHVLVLVCIKLLHTPRVSWASWSCISPTVKLCDCYIAQRTSRTVTDEGIYSEQYHSNCKLFLHNNIYT